MLAPFQNYLYWTEKCWEKCVMPCKMNLKTAQLSSFCTVTHTSPRYMLTVCWPWHKSSVDIQYSNTFSTFSLFEKVSHQFSFHRLLKIDPLLWSADFLPIQPRCNFSWEATWRSLHCSPSVCLLRLFCQPAALQG